VAALLVGCGSDDDASGDGGARDGGADAATGDAAAEGTGHAFGEGCEGTDDCAPRLFCDREVDQSFDADDLPPGTAQVPSSAFPGGVCTRLPAAPYDDTGSGGSCDPSLAAGEQGCGADGVCVAVLLDSGTVYACRPRCDASDTDGPCERFGYTCSFSVGACIEGCQSDEECRLLPVDRDGDGSIDAITYDDASNAVCDAKNFRCTTTEDGPGATGAACERADDCEADGYCIQPLRGLSDAAFPDGYCTKFGCDLPGRECEDGATCAPLRPLRSNARTAPACFTTCKIGAEPADDRVGAKGHGQGCREGYRCHYNGGAAEEGEGVCVGGNYNDVRKNNVGQACETDADCYSPFGLGACLTLTVNGISVGGACTIEDCAVPALPGDVCGPGNQCIGLNGDTTFCVHSCATADDCGAGSACTDDDDDPSTPKICYPVCRTDDDCRKGDERCDVASGQAAGQCVASRP
jgi:hypothetical protein